MRLSSGLAHWIVAGVALLFLSSQVMAGEKEGKPGREGKGGEPKAAKEDKPGKEGREGKRGEAKAPPAAPLSKEVMQLANPQQCAQGVDPIDLATKLFPALSDQQKAQLAQLTQSLRKDARQARDGVDAKYAEKLKTEVLAGADKEKFDAVLAALNKYRDALRTAIDELAAKVGVEAAFQVAQGGKAPGGPALLRLLGLTKEQEEKLRQLDAETKKAVEDAKAAIQKPAEESKEAMKKYRDDVEAAAKKAQADLEAKIDGLLTAEQKQKKSDLAKVAESLGQKLKAARDALEADLKAIK